MLDLNKTDTSTHNAHLAMEIVSVNTGYNIEEKTIISNLQQVVRVVNRTDIHGSLKNLGKIRRLDVLLPAGFE